MITQPKIFRRGMWALPSMLVAALLAADASSLMTSTKYPAPWYSSSWLAQPVTNLYLVFYPVREYTTTNAIKSETWRVREVQAGRAVFWTTLERKSISP